ncbi:MAG: ribosome silencing factor [Cytophagales bacterium]|nr:ribosome silencing factor [Cytophagales bacterium]
MVKSEQLQRLVVEGMLERKAEKIAVIDLKNIKNAVADYFVICSANSDTQAQAISESIDEVVYKTAGMHPWHEEGKTNREWILIDYVDVVAHVFVKHRRDHYALEELWGDAAITLIDETVASQER